MVALLEQTQPSAPLSVAEKERLRELERVVEKHLESFLTCGRCLKEIRDKRLYRQHFSTFEQYVRERWSLARSRADELCRSTTTAELLLTTTGSAESATPLPANIPEVVLRPISALPDPDLQSQAWRLAASVSPEGRPTHTTTAKITRLIRESIEGDSKRALPAREQSFTLPVQRLAKIDSFDINVCLLHIKTPEQAERISNACAVVADRCHQVRDQLQTRFPDAHFDYQTSPAH